MANSALLRIDCFDIPSNLHENVSSHQCVYSAIIRIDFDLTLNLTRLLMSLLDKPLLLDPSVLVDCHSPLTNVFKKLPSFRHYLKVDNELLAAERTVHEGLNYIQVITESEALNISDNFHSYLNR